MLVSGGFLFKKYLYMKRVVDWKVWYEELVELLLNSLSPCCKLLYFTSSLQLLTYRILNFTKDGIPDSVQRRIFYNSFRLWQSAAGIDIRECDQCREADILISFVQRRHVDRYPFDGQGGTLAHAFYPLSNKGNNHSRLMSLSFLLVTGSESSRYRMSEHFWHPVAHVQKLQMTLAYVPLGWYSNRTGTSVDDGKAREKDWTRLPEPNLQLCYWSSQLFNLRTPSSFDVPVLLPNQPIIVPRAGRFFDKLSRMALGTRMR